MASRLRHPLIDGRLGSCLLGSTTPDIRLLSGSPREETHFFDLASTSAESGVQVLFRTHPSLAKGAAQSEATRSFVAGYLSHLVTDEVWITEIYRPFFGPSSPRGREPAANILDRLLQFEIDRQVRSGKAQMATFQAELEGSECGVELGFIDADSLAQWRRFVCGLLAREPDWERFKFIVRRFMPEDKADQEKVEPLFSSLPAAATSIFEEVGAGKVEGFIERSVVGSVAAVGEYLN